jgi:hypothetical protein
MIILKSGSYGAEISGLKPETALAINVLHSVFQFLGFDEMIVSEITGWKHMVGSAHYPGYAFDVSDKKFTKAEKKKILEYGAKALGDRYLIIIENEDTENSHFHIQLQKKALQYKNKHYDDKFLKD